MPLTPEDVANKQFTSTRLKPGYDETEVDEFLDEVEAELTRLYRENDDLRSRLAAGGPAAATPAAAPISAPISGPISAPPPTVDPAVARENEELRAKLAAAQRQLSEANQRSATAAQVAPPAQAAAPVAAPAAAQGANPSEGATGILALAQRTADEHVAEARTQADRIVGEARSRAEQLKRETEEKHRQTVSTLESERVSLERKVEELRNFEREYRSRLKTYLEGQLLELEGRGSEASRSSNPLAGGGGSGAQGSPGAAPQTQQAQPPAQQPPPAQQAQSPAQQSPPAQQPPPAQQAQPARGPFSPGAPVGGGDAPSGPPKQPGSGYHLDEGSDQQS